MGNGAWRPAADVPGATVIERMSTVSGCSQASRCRGASSHRSHATVNHDTGQGSLEAGRNRTAPPRIAILGSCVTRDPFAKPVAEGLDLVQYMARRALGSFMGRFRSDRRGERLARPRLRLRRRDPRRGPSAPCQRVQPGLECRASLALRPVPLCAGVQPRAAQSDQRPCVCLTAPAARPGRGQTEDGLVSTGAVKVSEVEVCGVV